MGQPVRNQEADELMAAITNGGNGTLNKTINEIRSRGVRLQPINVIFDLDGTLADITHRLHYIKGEKKNWDAFHAACVDDAPKENVIEIFKTMARNYQVTIVSGRSSVVRQETLDWLAKHDIRPHGLIMRDAGDFSPDHELKRHWLQTFRLGHKSDILCVFDDRQRVVDMWREEGLTCLQVEAWKEEE